MIGVEAAEYSVHADAIIAGVDVEDMSLDLQSIVASYVARRDSGDVRGKAAHARAVVRRADREGLRVEVEQTVKELGAEIKARNEGRDDADKIRPESRKRDDLAAALAADDARQE